MWDIEEEARRRLRLVWANAVNAPYTILITPKITNKGANLI